jgi:hypothetical protein
VVNIYTITLISRWTLIVRSAPSMGKMWPGPPSEVPQASQR